MKYSLMQKKVLESPNQFLINWQEIGEVDGKSRIMLNWSLIKQDYGFDLQLHNNTTTKKSTNSGNKYYN